MRPYLAIIADSFHAAFASRLLWIVLAAIVLFLIALAPIGYREVYTVDFVPADVHSSGRLTGLLAEALESEQPSPARSVAAALPEDLRTEIRAAAEGEGTGPGRWRYATAFNALLASDDWHDAELWKGTPRLGELRELDEQSADELDPRLRERRARLRLEAAFPGVFRPRPERSLVITYAHLESPAELPLGRQQFVDLLNQWVLPQILYYLLGVGAVFVGVLVTAPIIPEMLQPGALHLLLSKPVSRPALYLSKFVGGCAFVLLCVAPLVIGLWLIAGFRMGIWNHRLLYCIPVLVFLFAVYYSVSALAALHWRSAIISVVVTVLFWFGCFAVGTTAAMFDAFVAGPARVRQLAIADEALFVSTESGGLLRLGWDQPAYDPVIESGFGNRYRILGPVALADGRIVAAQVPQNQFNMFGSEDVNLIVLDADLQWRQQIGLQLPVGTHALRASPDGGLFAAASGGLFYAPGENLVAEEGQAEPPLAPQGLFGGIQRLLGNTAAGFTAVTPSGLTMAPPSAFAVLPSGQIIVYSRGRLVRLSRDSDDGQWSVVADAMTAGDLTLETRLAATSAHVVIARRGEPWRVYGTEELQEVAQLPFPETVSVVSLHGSPTAERVVGTLSDRRAALLTFAAVTPRVQPQLAFPSFAYQDHVEAAAWDTDGTLWLAHHIDRVTAIDPASGAVVRDLDPARGFWRLVTAWVVTPLRYIVPQTGEVSEAITAIVGGRQDLEFQAGGETQREQLNVVRPLATCGAFTALMLFFGCLYVYRQDF